MSLEEFNWEGNFDDLLSSKSPPNQGIGTHKPDLVDNLSNNWEGETETTNRPKRRYRDMEDSL